VALANERVRDTVDDLSERIAELADLVGKITRMATRIGSVAATAIGGLKAGAKIFGLGRKKKPGAGPRLRERDAERARDEKPRLRRRR
jgi:hypothetical protein